MAATSSGFDDRHLEFHFGSRPMSGNVHSVISELGTADNMGLEVGIAVPSLTVHKLFPLPVSVAVILNSVSGRRGNVEQCRQCHV